MNPGLVCTRHRRCEFPKRHSANWQRTPARLQELEGSVPGKTGIAGLRIIVNVQDDIASENLAAEHCCGHRCTNPLGQAWHDQPPISKAGTRTHPCRPVGCRHRYSGVPGLFLNRGLPSRSVVMLLGTYVLDPASMQGELDIRCRSPFAESTNWGATLTFPSPR
jgi:hypothetical protein